jgi:hypothetical protein
VLQHLKVIKLSFQKEKKKKDTKKRNGHRQYLTQILLKVFLHQVLKKAAQRQKKVAEAKSPKAPK